MNDRERAAAIQRLLTDGTVQDALQDVRKHYIQVWQNADSIDTREQQWFLIQALDRLEKELKVIADRGTFAALKESKQD